MRDRWSDAEAEQLVERYEARYGRELALRTYTSRLLGAEPGLVLHGGGNSSLKGTARDPFGDVRPALFVKASGWDMATIEPDGHVAVDLEGLRRWVADTSETADTSEAGAGESRLLRALLLDPDAATPSIEAPVHAMIPASFVDHTHADAILALTNRPDGEAVVRAALGPEVAVLPYVPPGIELARAVARALAEHPEATAMVWRFHGLITWGETARQSYQRMIELVQRAEEVLERSRLGSASAVSAIAGDAVGDEQAAADSRLARWAPILRGALARESGDPDRPWHRVVLRALTDAATRARLALPGARELLVSSPLTADHLIRTRPLPLWLDGLEPDGPDGDGDTEGDGGAVDERSRAHLAAALDGYRRDYLAYVERHRARLALGIEPFTPQPRVVLIPGVGAIAVGEDAREAEIARDITERSLAAKEAIAAAGSRYQGLSEEHLFDMEYRPQQVAKLRAAAAPAGGAPLSGTVALVTGAAGAIGSGVVEGLLEAGAHVAVTDLAGSRLDRLAEELAGRFPGRVLAAPLDVSDPAAVATAFDRVQAAWGGLDLLVINAGLAHVASLEELEPADFQRLSRVNVEGALNLLRQAARLFRRQGTGGDVVLVSTKNVFAPGARFGAYSATKAAAHQLARIASLELAPLDVRVNMVAPDAVFGGPERPSGLWAEVGPDRMRARGLSPEELEEYYRTRNLLQARVTPRHVANAVLFFATRQTPTTGVTLPVDGGLPDATPR